MDDAQAVKRVHRLARTGRLAEIREGLGLTQVDVARHLGVHASSVSRWEGGQMRCRSDRAMALLDLLEVE